VIAPCARRRRNRYAKPLYRDAVDKWQNYAAWLQPLREALGDDLL
jgi:hypothetical protein